MRPCRLFRCLPIEGGAVPHKEGRYCGRLVQKQHIWSIEKRRAS
jgi:hypothetical protein